MKTVFDKEYKAKFKAAGLLDRRHHCSKVRMSHVCTYVHTRVYVCTYVRLYIHVCRYVHTRAYVCTYIDRHSGGYEHNTCVCVYVCIIYICMHTHTYTHTHACI